MKELILAAAVGQGVDPQDDIVRAAIDAAAARVATAWTAPTHLDSSDGTDMGLDLPVGACVARYRCMAEPKN